MILANLLHLSYNMWGDWNNPHMGKYWCHQPYLRFDEDVWNQLLKEMVKAKMNMVVIDLGDGVQYQSHPEIPVEHAWSRQKLRDEIKKCRDMGLEPIPKMNFSSCHDIWLGDYSHMLSTKKYYEVVKDLINEGIELFDKPRFFHVGMDEEETIHQEAFQYICSRKFDLWWHDFNFFRETVESNGVRPWMWADYVWNHKDEFYKNMDRKVLQSNWHREPVSGPAKHVYGAIHNHNIACAEAYIELDKAGFDQVPAVSNWETPENIENTIKWCSENCSKERIKGYFLTPWRPTLPATLDKHLDAIDHFAKCIQEHNLA